MMKRKSYWQLSKLLTILLGVGGLVSCGENEKSSSVLVLSTSADNPPFEFYERHIDNNQVTGFDVALAKEIANQLGYELEIKDTPFGSIIPSLQTGRADFAMASLSITKEREKAIDFSIPYYETKGAMITLPGVVLKNEEALRGKTIGVQLGSSYEQALRQSAQKYPDIRIHSLGHTNELVQELRSGRIDGVLTEESVAKAYVGSNRDIDMSLIDGFDSLFSIAFPKGSKLVSQFNEVIEKLKKEGKIENLKVQWLKAS